MANISRWNRWFEEHADLIRPERTADDVRRAKAEGKTAIVFGFQNCSPIEDDVGMVPASAEARRRGAGAELDDNE